MDGRKKIRVGRRYRVGQNCGLDSGRIGYGVVQDPKLVRQTEGWYGEVSFTGRMAVVLLKDERGYFAPFRSSVKEV